MERSVLVPGECVDCGHPNLRPEGHASWCRGGRPSERAPRGRLPGPTLHGGGFAHVVGFYDDDGEERAG